MIKIPETPEELAKKLTGYRAKHNLTQKAFADILGVSHSVICLWETQEINRYKTKNPMPNASYLIELGKLLNMNPKSYKKKPKRKYDNSYRSSLK